MHTLQRYREGNPSYAAQRCKKRGKRHKSASLTFIQQQYLYKESAEGNLVLFPGRKPSSQTKPGFMPNP